MAHGYPHHQAARIIARMRSVAPPCRLRGRSGKEEMFWSQRPAKRSHAGPMGGSAVPPARDRLPARFGNAELQGAFPDSRRRPTAGVTRIPVFGAAGGR